jgi:xanthine dehydrogenase molybdopterin-binding subunit B
MAYAAREVVASAARTTTGNSGLLTIGGSAQTGGESPYLNLLVNITAVGGTPNLVLSVEWTMDGTNFATVDTTADAFAALTAVAARVKQFLVKAPQYRIVWTITGTTPSFTFTVHEYAL